MLLPVAPQNIRVIAQNLVHYIAPEYRYVLKDCYAGKRVDSTALSRALTTGAMLPLSVLSFSDEKRADITDMFVTLQNWAAVEFHKHQGNEGVTGTMGPTAQVDDQSGPSANVTPWMLIEELRYKLAEQRGGYEARLAMLQENLEALQQSEQDDAASYDALVKENEALDKQVDQLTTDGGVIIARYEELTAEKQSLIKEAEERSAWNKEITDKCGALANENDALRVHNKQLAQTIHDKSYTIETYTRKNIEMEQQLACAKDRLRHYHEAFEVMSAVVTSE